MWMFPSKILRSTTCFCHKCGLIEGILGGKLNITEHVLHFKSIFNRFY